jgi:hypothetical protein
VNFSRDLIFKVIKDKHMPRVFIETGTYRGDSVREVLHDFDIIHTIELSQEWFKNAVEQFKNKKNVSCHLGDSVEVLDKLTASIDEPVFFFLDAHYSGAPTAMGKEECPLLRELRVISTRNKKDIILIDDANLFGKKAIFGVEGSSLYPLFEGNWKGITINSVKKALGSNRRNLFFKVNYYQLLILTNQKKMDMSIYLLKFFKERLKRFLSRNYNTVVKCLGFKK